jgi:hypothetical protein
MTHNRNWLLRHIGEAEYNRDASLAAADLARLRYRRSKRHADYRDWKDNIRQAWAMRRIVRNTRKELGA